MDIFWWVLMIIITIPFWMPMAIVILAIIVFTICGAGVLVLEAINEYRRFRRR